MSDVRGYSGIAETTDPSALAHLLNEHRAAMNHAILDEDGTVMQFVGDAVMACFGAPVAAGRPRRPRVRRRDRDASRRRSRSTSDVGRARAAAVRARHRPVDRPGRGRAARLRGTPRVHARRRHREPRAAAAGSRAARRAVSCSARRRAPRSASPPECEPLGEQAVKGRQAAVRAYRVPGGRQPR